MPFVSATVASAVIGGADIGLSLYGSSKSSEAAKKQSQAEQRAESLRQQQMQLESIRRERDIMRQAQAARAQSISQAVNDGVSATGSSILPGLQGQIASQESRSVTATEENLAIGNATFAANADASRARADKAEGAAWTDFGKTLFQSSDKISNIGTQAGLFKA